ncbi:DNA-directed RNA polymerase I subunit rpa49 [Tripterygium wilfordii]|nr:DNA-directed RNA polymerase I subunit rpa49 [Tripterygium wilfordii]
MADIETGSQFHDLEDEVSERKKRRKEKKRKRDKEKKIEEVEANIEEDKLQAQIQVFPDKAEKIPPIVGYFPSGYDPCRQESEQQSPTARVYRHQAKNRSGRLHLVVRPPKTKVNFVGTNFSGEATAPQFCTYALGVLDKETHTLKIMPIAGNKIFRMEPNVGGSDIVAKEPSDMAQSDISEPKTDGDVDSRRYWTKRAIKQHKKLHALNQEDDPESQKIVGDKIKEVVANKEALEGTSADVARNVPPHNASATVPEEAYPLEKIILRGEWDFLMDIYEVLQAEAEVVIKNYPIFVGNRIQRLQEIQDDEEKKTLCCILSYIAHLIKFKDLHSMDGYSSAKNHKFPSILRQKFGTMFDPESKRLSTVKNDLLISYVLVLTLYADGFRTSISDIAKDLRMHSYMLRAHFENLGCKLGQENKSLVATLPVPLKFPDVRRRRRR